MTEHHGITGHQMGAHGSFIHVTVSVGGGEGNADTRLLLLPLPGEKVVVLACGIERTDETLVSAFRSALKTATEEVCKPAKSHKWSAIIGEAPSVFQGNPQQISGSFSLDGLKLSSTERLFWQPGVSASPTMSSMQLHSSIPILVRGTSVGYDWAHNAKRDAAEKLGLLVAFLSVVWNLHIDVTEGPVPLALGEVRLPDRHPGLGEFNILPVLEASTVGNLTVPEWLSGAWLMTRRRSKIKSSVSMYMEGLRVEDRHPSLALVAYVAAVEAVSLMLFEEKRCKECCNHLDVGNKFLETLKLVTAGPDFELLRLIYGDRSKTVHQGKLHGTELALGDFSFGVLSDDSSIFFKLNSLGIVKRAARKLLVLAMRSQLPKKMHYAKRDPSS
ncbi:hypothetical protein ACIGZH_21120 [Streptomyces sp. NPDC058319]|uniref:hypothetical protein n=1 Tax=unclassified Streptomyces TaxID=2593676 RepID=UPI0036E60227